MFALAIHGGAGVINRENLPEEVEKIYLEGLTRALDAGYSILEKGGSAVEAVEASVIMLEDIDLFNAGRGSVFTADGTQDMEAAIMSGRTLNAGAACGLRNIKNPITLARAVMEHSDYVFLNGQGAEKFAKENNIIFEKDDYFFNRKRYQQMLEAKKKSLKEAEEKEMGTVGAVAMDVHGDLAAATSTGGLTNKKYGRIGDSPIIGAGTYANNLTCAVSCTGTGEFFMRTVTAYDISCLLEYKGMSLNEACEFVVKEKLVKMGGEGGIIAVDTKGNLTLVFNSEGMYRASRKENEKSVVAIF